jgi:cytochrome P450 family 20 subfamily A
MPTLKPDHPEAGNFPSLAASGSLHQFLLAKHSQLGGIFAFWWGTTKVVSVASLKGLKSISTLRNRPILLFSLLEPMIGAKSLQYANDEDLDTRMKDYVRPAFTHSNLSSLYHMLTSTAMECVRDLTVAAEKDQPVPLKSMMLSVATLAVGQVIFGVKFEPRECTELQENYDRCWREIQSRLVGSFPVQGDGRQEIFEKSLEYFRKLTLKLKSASLGANAPRSLVALLGKANVSEEQIVSEVITFLVGGFHTTGNALAWALIYLAQNPKVQAEVQREVSETLQEDLCPSFEQLKELPYLDQVIEETLRCSNLAPFAARYSDKDLEIEGFAIPAQTPIVIPLGVTFQNPEIFPQPELFDPDRFCPAAKEARKSLGVVAYAPFGFAGGRVCPGRVLSNTEMKVVLGAVLRSFTITLAEPQKKIVPEFGLVTTPKEEVYIKVVKR